ncbi:protein DEPP1 [Rhinatrema bivittatum]|uniref:protein DEPP1 n=1 Tax=Rhinatrema bivittatum TaxID=194408 RepID=UPI001126D4C6|nr:protein DEPP1 [Rhinatrema bivittatum]
MRSKLDIFVNYLPTICEYAEEASQDETQEKHEEASTKTPSSQALDEYIKSIRQLAQPTSLSEDALRIQPSAQNKLQRRNNVKHVPSLRNHESKTVPSMHGTSLQDINIQFQHQTFLNNTDPLNLLYGCYEKKTNKENSPLTRIPANFHCPQSLTTTCNPASAVHPQKQTEMGKKCSKWGVKCCEMKACGNAIQKMDDCTETSGKRSQAQRLHRK